MAREATRVSSHDVVTNVIHLSTLWVHGTLIELASMCFATHKNDIHLHIGQFVITYWLLSHPQGSKSARSLIV